MLRGILGVIVGYLAMAIIVFGGLTVAYLALGADRSFKPDSYDISTTWIAVWLIVGVIAAIVGGFVCMLISRTMTAPMVLAGIVLVFGLILAIPQLTKDDAAKPGPRTGDVSNMEAMADAQAPNWMNLANPIIGAIGILIGASIRGSRKATKA